MPDIPQSELGETMTVHVEADLSSFRQDIGEATHLARGFGAALSSAFESAIVKGKSLSDVLKELALRLARLAIDALLKPLAGGLSSAVGAALQGVVPFAKGGLLGSGAVQAFASGGVIGGPTLFEAGQALGSGALGSRVLGLAGEAGPEAILPLARGSDGRLGVASHGEARPISITFNIQTPDVEGFRRARGQIAADLSRALERGYRNR